MATEYELETCLECGAAVISNWMKKHLEWHKSQVAAHLFGGDTTQLLAGGP